MLHSSLLPVSSFSPASNLPAILSTLRKVAAGAGSLQLTKKAHAFAVVLGLDRHHLISSSLISAYSLFGFPVLSQLIFFASSSPNIFLLNSLLAAFARNGCQRGILAAFHYMRTVSAPPPDGYTLAIVAKALTELADPINGRAIHSLVTRVGFFSDTVLANTLVLLYSRCGYQNDAQHLFEEIPHRTVASWNTLISDHLNIQSGKEWELVREMQLEGIKPNGFTVSLLLPHCASGSNSAGRALGRQIHSYIVRHELGFNSDLHVGSCLINLYCKSDNAKTGRRVFDHELTRNAFTWTAMISGYINSGEFDTALSLFQSMNRSNDVQPNAVTVATVLSAVGSLTALDDGKQIHGFIFRRWLADETLVNNALIVMYSKCGCLATARGVFDDESWVKDRISWNSIISCCGTHGMGKEALFLFNRMCSLGIEPDHGTGLGVLSACSRAGLVREGIKTFISLTKHHGIIASHDMCSLIIDMLGRAGHLELALDFINSMQSEPIPSVWGALLGAAVSHGDEEVQRLASKVLIEAEPENPSHHVSLSNFHASIKQWDVVEEVRKKMATKGLRKSPGVSWIAVGGKVHTFYIADTSHFSSYLIYEALEVLSREIRDAAKIDNCGHMTSMCDVHMHEFSSRILTQVCQNITAEKE